MSDTPFKDITEEVMSEQVEAEAKAEAPEVKPDAQEEPKEEPQEETFAEKPDLAGKTPEELEEIYQNWQKAYTAKRQKETKELKEYQAKIAELEKKASQPAPVQNVDAEKLESQAREQVELGNMTVQQYTEYMKQVMTDQAREVARQEYQELVAKEREEQLASKALEQFEAADSRLNEHSPEYNESFKAEVQRELAELLDKHLEETGSYQGFDAHTLTKQIVERRDAQLDEIIKKRTIQSTQAARMREAKAKKSGVKGTSKDGQSIGGDSIRDILEEAVDSSA